jgi:ABC-2 type transport system ATP-binding protein
MLRIDRSLIDERIDDIVDFAGIGGFIDQPVKNYSSGMYVRLAFAVSVNIDPDILLIDEVLAVGDANFQDKCMQKFNEFRRRGKTIVLASHALGHLQTICDDVAQLDQGRLAGIRRAGLGSMSEPDPIEHVQQRIDTGSRRVRITAVEVLDESGFSVERVQTGDEIAFRIHYAAAEPVDRPVFALALDDEAGVRAWAQHSRDSMLAPHRISGTGSIDLHIPRLLLQSGGYTLHASIGDDAISEAYDALPDAARLQVANHSLTESAGVAVLGGTWGNALSRQPAAHREAEQP